MEDIGDLYQKVTIETLHNDVLLAIFISCLNQFHRTDSDAWQMLAHVCQRWQHLIFAFLDYLNVRLRCSIEKLRGEMMRIWPALPIAVLGSNVNEDMDDVVVALEQRDRICEISLDLYSGFNLDTVVSTMIVPFPGLKYLSLMAHEVPAPVFPDTFLGGSALRLRSLRLHGIPFPALRNLLLSARSLVDLNLSGISRSRTFLPEAIVNHISELSRLETLSLEFRSHRSCLAPGVTPSGEAGQ